MLGLELSLEPCEVSRALRLEICEPASAAAFCSSLAPGFARAARFGFLRASSRPRTCALLVGVRLKLFFKLAHLVLVLLVQLVRTLGIFALLFVTLGHREHRLLLLLAQRGLKRSLLGLSLGYKVLFDGRRRATHKLGCRELRVAPRLEPRAARRARLRLGREPRFECGCLLRLLLAQSARGFEVGIGRVLPRLLLRYRGVHLGCKLLLKRGRLGCGLALDGQELRLFGTRRARQLRSRLLRLALRIEPRFECRTLLVGVSLHLRLEFSHAPSVLIRELLRTRAIVSPRVAPLLAPCLGLCQRLTALLGELAIERSHFGVGCTHELRRRSRVERHASRSGCRLPCLLAFTQPVLQRCPARLGLLPEPRLDRGRRPRLELAQPARGRQVSVLLGVTCGLARDSCARVGLDLVLERLRLDRALGLHPRKLRSSGLLLLDRRAGPLERGEVRLLALSRALS